MNTCQNNPQSLLCRHRSGSQTPMNTRSPSATLKMRETSKLIFGRRFPDALPKNRHSSCPSVSDHECFDVISLCEIELCDAGSRCVDEGNRPIESLAGWSASMRKSIGIGFPVEEILVMAHLEQSVPTVLFEGVCDWRGDFFRGETDEMFL